MKFRIINSDELPLANSMVAISGHFSHFLGPLLAGLGLSIIGNALGYKTVIVIPEPQTQEKKDAIRFTGAELIEVPAVPYSDENNYIKYSGRLANELDKKLKNGAYWANQFDNIANKNAHIKTKPRPWFFDLNFKKN